MGKRVTVTPADREAWIGYEDFDGAFAERIRTGSEDNTSGLQMFARHRASEAERVREAATALVAKLDECDPHLTSMFSFALAHDHLYSGPTYGEELEALRAAVNGAK